MVAQTEGTSRFREKNAVPAHRLIDHQYQLLTLTSDPRAVASFLAGLVRGSVSDITSPPAASADDSDRGFYDDWAKRLIAQNRSLNDAARSLHRLHDEDTLGLLEEARSALRNGMASTGRDRTEDFRDAQNLLRGLQNDMAGGRNYAIWFDIGWLKWQTDNLTEAEEAFYQANRLSKTAGNAYYPFALRHLAYVQYLQERYEQAYATIQRALEASPDDADVRYEAARYAAALGNKDEAASLFEASLAANPALLSLSEHETDFTILGSDLNSRMENAVALGARSIEEELGRWRKALALVKEAEGRAGISLPVPPALQNAVSPTPAAAKGSKQSYFAMTEAHQAVSGKGQAVLDAGAKLIEEAISAADVDVERPRRQMEKLQQDKQMWERTLKTLEEEARQSGYPLTGATGMTAFKLRMQKRDKQAASVRISYQNCQHNLITVNKQISETVPAMERAVAEAQAKVAPLRSTLEWLKAQSV
jgi:tetratricopeptide (TPR) repeat protein